MQGECQPCTQMTAGEWFYCCKAHEMPNECPAVDYTRHNLDGATYLLNSDIKVIIDVLWGQPIKLGQVASTSELHENQRNDLIFFEIIPCHSCGASEVQT